MRGIIDIDCDCECGHKQSDHGSGRLNSQCHSYHCRCSRFTPATMKVIAAGQAVKVAWVESK